MPRYVGSGNSIKHVVEAGEQVKDNFVASRHQPISKEVKVFLSEWSRFKTAAKAAEAASLKEDLVRDALSDADAARDEAVRVLDRKLIEAGSPPKASSFKPFGAPAPSLLVKLAHGEQTKVVAKLVKAISSKKQSAGVVAAVKALSKSNDAVIAAELRVKAIAETAARARGVREGLDRQTRAALSKLKLQVRLAETDGLVGAYSQLFATDAKSAKKSEPVSAVPS
ncbi:MAG: hypothetical protein ACO1OB_31155 [Archangium sp.]